MLVGGMLPFSEAMALTKKAGFNFGVDRWELWVKRSLVERAERIPGTNLYGLQPQQWARLKMLIVIDHQLYGRKSPDGVAYFAAVSGIDVPADLVAAYISKSLKTFYGLLRRRAVQISNGRVDPRTMVESDARKLAGAMAADLLRIVKIRNPIKRQFLKQFTDELSFVVVCMTYNVLPNRSLVNVFRRIANAIFTAGTAPLAAQRLRRVLDSERARLVDPTVGDNKILKEIDIASRNDPGLLLRACHDSGLAFASAQRAFGSDRTSPRRPPSDLKGAARDTVRTFYALLPMISALFLAFNLDDPESKFLINLRRSQGATFERNLRRLDRITEWQRRRLEKGL
jgi:hypothetical protein